MIVQDGFVLCVVSCHLPGQGVLRGVTRRMDPMEVLGNLYELHLVISLMVLCNIENGLPRIYGFMQMRKKKENKKQDS